MPIRDLWAPAPEELLRKAEILYEQLEYEKAAECLSGVLTHPDVAELDLARAYLYRGVSYTALNRSRDAEINFINVLRLRPLFRLPDGVSPTINADFERALHQLGMPLTVPLDQSSEYEAPERVVVNLRAPKDRIAGSAIALEIAVFDPENQVTELVLRWRRIDSVYSVKRLPFDPSKHELSVMISEDEVGKESGTLACYLVALNDKGHQVATAGTDKKPIRIRIIEEPSWWSLVS